MIILAGIVAGFFGGIALTLLLAIAECGDVS